MTNVRIVSYIRTINLKQTKLANMKKFKLSGTVTISIYTEVEAESLEQAIEIAERREIEKEEYDSSHQATCVWVTGDYDGEPINITEI